VVDAICAIIKYEGDLQRPAISLRQSIASAVPVWYWGMLVWIQQMCVWPWSAGPCVAVSIWRKGRMGEVAIF